MKSLFLVVCSFIFIAELTAQLDTLKPASFSDSCAWRTTGGQYIPDLALFSNPLGGYVCGNSIYGARTKAQKFYHQDGILKQVGFLIRKKTQAPFPGNIRAKVYNVDPATGKPGDSLAISSFYSVGNIKSFINVDSANNLTILNFPDSVILPDTFFIGLDLTLLASGDTSLGILGDTIGLWSTKDGCFSGEQLAWEEDSVGAWHPFNDGTMSTSWGLDIDMAIFPIGNGFESIVDGLVQNEPVRINVYPNPSDGIIVFDGDWTNQTKNRIVLFSADGRIVFSKTIQLGDSGSYVIQTKHLLPGIYFYQISNGNSLDIISGKILIKK